MCCFSQPVKSVRATNIFARAGAEDRQFLAYSMSLEAPKDLAMILPLPVRTPAGEKDVEFIDLKRYPDLFKDLDKGFPALYSFGGGGGSIKRAAGPAPAKLEVVRVGNFEASFVPTINDFSRLDERFRLPRETWNKLPQYESYGFAVFKLKPGAATIHPMAFSFPRRDANALFFPTVHIHDGKVHSKAAFDHALYCQPHPDQHLELINDWQESRGHARSFVAIDRTKGLIVPNQHCYKRELRGELPNQDIYLKVERL